VTLFPHDFSLPYDVTVISVPESLDFLQSISSKFYKQLLRQYSCAKKLQNQTVIREKLHKTLLDKKGTRKMLMKLTPDLKA
jgi:hypothetical protein